MDSAWDAYCEIPLLRSPQQLHPSPKGVNYLWFSSFLHTFPLWPMGIIDSESMPPCGVGSFLQAF